VAINVKGIKLGFAAATLCRTASGASGQENEMT